MVENIYMLSDKEIIKRISAKLKELRLLQNISRQDIAVSSGVSTPSIARMENGEIKSFESFLRMLRTLGKMDIFQPFMQEEDISPSEYFKLVHENKTTKRRRASRSTTNHQKEEFEW